MNSKLFWLSAGLGVMLAGTTLRGEPFRPETVPAEARWIAHLDVKSLVETTVGQNLLDHLSASKTGRQVDAISAIFGFDLRRDLFALTLFGTSDEPDAAALLARLDFDADRLVTILRGNESYQESTYLGHQVHSWIDANRAADGRQYGAFLPGGLLAIGRGQTVLQQLLDVLDARLPGMSPDAIFGLPLPHDSPVLLATADLRQVSSLDPRAAVLRAATAGQWSMAERDGRIEGVLQIVAADASAASQIFLVGQGMIALGHMIRAEHPWLGTLLDGLNLRLADNLLRLEVRLPLTAVLQFIDESLAP